MKLIEVTDRAVWDEFVGGSAAGHPLQLWGWGESKRANRWTPHRLLLVSDDGAPLAGAQVLMWLIPRTGRRIAYVPRGPVVDPTLPQAATLLKELAVWARAHRALYVRVEPAWTAAPALFGHGWVRAANSIQLRGTYTIDLAKGESDLLEPMARKHRQYIRKAERDGVTVRREIDGDVAPMLELYQQTAERAGFGIHPRGYYSQLLAELGDANHLYYAEHEGKVVAFLWLAAAGSTAYELYGGVDATGQEIKANYFLKWHAMMAMKAAGYTVYDFNGRLNEGVSRFKDGFGPDSTDWIGTWDFPLNALGYQLWERLWPLAKPVGRRIMKAIKH